MNKVPNHVAIIMDGNGRWATEKGMVRTEGHKKGAETLEKLAVHILNTGTKYLSVYAFSTDNFKRPETEVSFLMNLFIKMFKTKMEKIIKNDIRVIFSGRKENLRDDVLNAMDSIVEKSKNNKNGTLNIMLNGELLACDVTANQENPEYARVDSKYEEVIDWFNKLT